MLNYFLFEHILKCNLFPWSQSWIFSTISPVFSVTWSFRYHSNILICCFRNNVISMLKQLCYLICKPLYIFFQDSLTNKDLFKRTEFIRNWNLFNISVFTGTFDLIGSFCYSLLNLNNVLYKNTLTHT